MGLLDDMRKTVIESHPSVTFPKKGTFVDGTIVGTPRKVTMTDQASGREQEKFVFDLALNQPCWTKERSTPANPDPEELELPAGSVVTLWVQKQMASAVAKAVMASGASDISEGGRLVVKHHDSKRIEGRPKPQKLYEASYEAPKATLNMADVLGDDED